MQELKQGTPLQGGKYIIKRVLGQGGFGITYLAEQVSLGREVAIKEFFMKDSCSRDESTSEVSIPTTGSAVQVEQYRKKFLKEARTLASLDHSHIVSVIDVWEENGTVYYSMPYLPGGSLKDLVSQNGPLPEHDALNYVSQIARALKHMHQERHICHYDVKPANILLDLEGNAKLIDFGISKNYDAQGNETSTTPIGLTQGFAPLEQYDGIKDFSPASDVYALGATLYFLLTGQVPPSALELVQENASLNFDANISGQTKALVLKAMEPSIRKRPQSVDCFLQPQSIATSQRELDKTIAVPQKRSAPQKTINVVKPHPQQAYENHQQTKTFKHWFSKISGYVLLVVVFIVCLSVVAMQDDTISAKWYQMIAEQGNADAQYELGLCYDEGRGVKKDDQEAVKWYRKAAEQGMAAAQNKLGLRYDEGKGVKKDDAEAVKWYRKAAEQGYDVAQYNLAECYVVGEGVKKNYTEAVKWYRKAAEHGMAAAQTGLGLCYDEGWGVKKDDQEAVKWYRKAAEQGNADSQYNLALCYDDGEGVEKNHAEALKWLRKAVEKGNADAMNLLGRHYEGGWGVTKSVSEAVGWYRKAADKGCADAQYNLAVFYEEGRGMAKNKDEALKWYRKAAANGQEDAKTALKRLGVSK